jgi:hypothetical protein
MSRAFDELPEEVMLNILGFVPSRALGSTVSLVSRTLCRLVNTSSLWNDVRFNPTDSPGYVSAVLARFMFLIRSITLWSGCGELTEKISVLIGSKIPFEEIHLVADDVDSLEMDICHVFQLVGESTRILSFRLLNQNFYVFRSRMRLPPDGHVPCKSHLISLDLSAMTNIDDRMVEVIVASCPNLELLHIGHSPRYSSVGVRAIADGLPNLTSVYLGGEGDEEYIYHYLLSRRPCLSAFCWESTFEGLSGTAGQIGRMRDLQYLKFWCPIESVTTQAMFENANFGQLRTFGCMGVDEFDSAALKAIALASPQLEQLFVCGSTELIDDDAIKFLLESCPELRAVLLEGLETITGEGWLDIIGTLHPRVQCIVLAFWDRRHGPSPELLERADRARALNPKLCVLIGDTKYQYNENVTISRDDVWEVLCVMPRLCDLKARRVRYPNVLEAAAHQRIAQAEARDR